MAAAVIWVLSTIFISSTLSANLTATLRQYNTSVLPNQGICVNRTWASLKELHNTYKNCVVVQGNLEIAPIIRTRSKDFANISFPNLREVTGFLVVYRANGLTSLGQLFPNLARIRGVQLLNNYGLIIHDISTLKEIGLYGLVKIDRGGVIVWGLPQACFVDSVDWRAVAPRSRHVIDPQGDGRDRCDFPCTCTWNLTYNHCWNKMKCQIYLNGPEADKNCHEQCLGCRKTNSTQCNICRNFTHNGICVSKCPANTILLPDPQYCITKAECRNLNGWIWKNTCVFECPIGYVKVNKKSPTCRACKNCDKTCSSLVIQSVSALQDAGHCVYVNGSLTIHLRAVVEAMDELRTYLSRIQEVYDYIQVHGSLTISSLDFLSSLKRIRGRNLSKGAYSVIIYDMSNLQALFLNNVTENLIIDQGTIKMMNNPMLCMSQIEKLILRLPIKSTSDIDLPVGSNGYSGGCDEVSVDMQIRTVNETTAVVMFHTKNLNAHYSVLYVRLRPGLPGAHQTIVPETCSESEWNAVDAPFSYGQVYAMIELTSLRPASQYAVCVESFDPSLNKLARSIIYNFTTLVGVPEPPFIRELAASNSETVVIHWVDHKDYSPYLKRYELDVSLVEIHESDVGVKDQCEIVEPYEVDLSLHAVVMRPPPEYAKGCESMCGVLSSVTAGAMVEEFFDVCGTIDCNSYREERIKANSTIGKYVNTLSLDIKAPRNDFQIGGLAPFRDYRFSLRACTDFVCSRFSHSIVRTLPTERADIPVVKLVKMNNLTHISIKWEPPTLTNGIILSYTVEVLPMPQTDAMPNLMPKSFCVLANQTDSIVKSMKADKYMVRVCTRSMALDRVCSGWETYVPFSESAPTWWWMGGIFGVLLYVATLLIGCLSKRRKSTSFSDLTPIVDHTSSLQNESEPPAKMFSDFAYTIPLRESKID